MANERDSWRGVGELEEVEEMTNDREWRGGVVGLGVGEVVLQEDRWAHSPHV